MDCATMLSERLRNVKLDIGDYHATLGWIMGYWHGALPYEYVCRVNGGRSRDHAGRNPEYATARERSSCAAARVLWHAVVGDLMSKSSSLFLCASSQTCFPASRPPQRDPLPQRRRRRWRNNRKSWGRAQLTRPTSRSRACRRSSSTEGDCIVQFQPTFDEHAEETTFGLKILPDLAPHWAQTRIHRCGIKDAITSAIRSAGQAMPVAADARVEFQERCSVAAELRSR